MDANRSRSARDAERAAAVRRIRHGVNLTLPVVLAGAMTVTMNLTGAIPAADAAPRKPADRPRAFARAEVQKPVPASAPAPVTTPAAVAPASYTVVRGDTVSGIAERFGLRTADVLARNGLGWSSLIFPGQVLRLGGATPIAAAPAAPPAPASVATTYTIVRGDTVSGIAGRFGVSVQSVLDANGLVRTSIIYPGQKLRIPRAPSPAAHIETVAAVTPITPVADVTPTSGIRYTVRSGDTVWSIAQRFGVSTNAVLAANGLTASSIIHAGRTLVIPGGAAASSGSTTPLTTEMAANARVVIQVGRQLGVPDRGIVIALATAMQESGLRNLSYGDRDSVGVFQQRPSTGWGTRAQLMDVAHAARLFYGGPGNPNAGRTRGLLDIPGWQSLTLTQAAQKVQISAYPDAYAKWESSARAWLAALG
jgi:LysM repeat protein